MAQKKSAVIPLEIRKSMIDKESSELSLARQCKLLSVPRSSLYYKPVPESSKDLELMRQIDQLHTEDPTRGTRRMVECLKKQGFHVGRDRVRSLMKKMGIKVIYHEPRTTVIDRKVY